MTFVHIRNAKREIEADYVPSFPFMRLVAVWFLDDGPDLDLTDEEMADIEEQLAEQDFERRSQ
jgi:hypothetical protein